MNRRIIVLFILVLGVMPISILLFATSRSYPPVQDESSKIVSNNYVLREELPPQVANYALNVLSSYKSSDKKPYTIYADGLERTSNGYVFRIIPKGKSISDSRTIVVLQVNNYGNLFGITVKINGEIQGIK